MAELIVEICKITEIKSHENADNLELAIIKGWQSVIPKGKYKAGDKILYIPIDALIPKEHAERWGIWKYLSTNERLGDMGRVRCAKLRGEPSFGVIIDLENSDWKIGQDLKDHYGIQKYIPPIKAAGDSEIPHPLFVSYTDIENLRNYPNIIQEGEPVQISEKIHGTNFRLGYIEGEIMAGSMGMRRKRPESETNTTYWLPYGNEGINNFLSSCHYLELDGRKLKQVILFGEIFGAGIQSLHYGAKRNPEFRIFDIYVNGKYLNDEDFEETCNFWNIPTVPILYKGPFSLEKVKELAQGNTVLNDQHIKEGVIIKPLVERNDPKIGRVILKYISDAYLLKAHAGKITDSEDI
jgi:RNA ligase (TIGR02306 family)